MPGPAPPQDMAPPTAEAALMAALEDISALQATLELARGLVHAGRRVDLAGLEGDAARLCGRLDALPPGFGVLLAGPLNALTAELDRLSAALRTA